MKYHYMLVDRIPDQLATGMVYHNADFGLAALLCPCNCGHRITLLVPDSHQISSVNGLATIKPSIAVCDADCKSHFYITAGKVDWLQAFSNAEAQYVMRGQIARHSAFNSVRVPWYGRVQRKLYKVFERITNIFNGKHR